MSVPRDRLFRRAGGWPRQVYPREASQLISELIRFVGNDRLLRAKDAYEKPERRTDGVFVARLRERQPLIEALNAFRRATLGLRRPLQSIDEELADLANVAGHCHVISPTLPEDLVRNHQDRLISLDGQLKPLLLEWKTASHFARANAALLMWLGVNESGPELVARSGNIEFDVECKHNSHMIFELLGQSEADQIAAAIFRRAALLKVAGSLRLSIPDAFDQRAMVDPQYWDANLAGVQGPGRGSIQLTGGLQLDYDLTTESGLEVDALEWQMEVNSPGDQPSRGYAQAKASGRLAIDPISLRIISPRREGSALVQHLWERKFEKAAEQCTAQRGAILSFEWDGVSDPKVFAESAGIQDLIRRTFDEHRHVAAISLRCESAPTRAFGLIDFSTPAYLAKSSVTDFPEVAELVALDQEF